MPTLPDIAVGVVAVLPAFALSMVGSLLTLYFQPDLFNDLGDTMQEMSSGTNLVLINVLLFASAGLGEEILFRGAIQPRFGIVLTAAFWALVHTQYQLSFVVLGLFMVGILFGLIRKHMSTTPAIIAHALYNAAVVLLQAYT
jgi:membrane protease YdiL (CAAX protease family)